MLRNVSIDGCDLFEHHLEIVFSDLPIYSAKHRLVFCFSTSVTFILFITIC